jgi:hypothetical protein
MDMSEESYNALLAEVYEHLHMAPSRALYWTVVVEQLFEKAGDNHRLFDRLYMDINYGPGLKVVEPDFLSAVRRRFNDDTRFVVWALAFGNRLGVDLQELSDRLYYMLRMLAEGVWNDPEVLRPILMIWGGFRISQSEVDKLIHAQPHLVRELIAKSDAWLGHICESSHSDLVTENDITEAVSRNGAFWVHVPKSMRTINLARLALSGDNEGRAIRYLANQNSVDEASLRIAASVAPRNTAYMIRRGTMPGFVYNDWHLHVQNPDIYWQISIEKDPLAIAELDVKDRSPALMALARTSGDPVVNFYDPYFVIRPLTERLRVVREFMRVHPERYKDIPSEYFRDSDVMLNALQDKRNVDFIVSIERDGELTINHWVRIIRHEPGRYRELSIAVEERAQKLELIRASNREIDHSDLIELRMRQISHLKRLLEDPAIIETALQGNPSLIYFMPLRVMFDPKWTQMFRDDPRTQFLFTPPQYIDFSGRFFSIDDFERVLEMRRMYESAIKTNPKRPARTNRPLTLVIFPTYDPGKSFRLSPMHQRLEDDNDVVYYEIQNKQEFALIMRLYLPLLRAGDEVILGAHGTKKTLVLSEEGTYAEGTYERRYINLDEDASDLADVISKENIPQGVTLIIYSCNSGAGGPWDENLAMMMYGDVFRRRWNLYVSMGMGYAAALPYGQMPPHKFNVRTMYLCAQNQCEMYFEGKSFFNFF